MVFVLVAACAGDDDPCAAVRCQNGGVPVASGDTCTCDCTAAVGFEGPECDVATVTRLLGEYSIDVGWSSTDGTSGTWQSQARIEASDSFVDRITIIPGGPVAYGGVWLYGCDMAAGDEYANDIQFFAIVSGDQITVPGQLADAYLDIEGSGTIATTPSTVSVDLTFDATAPQLQGCTTNFEVSFFKL